MTDIIARAKELLAGATPAPWEPHADHPKCLVNLETLFAVAVVPESDVQGSEDESNRNLIAAAPELAQALSEETWEYAVQVKLGAKWLFLGRGVGGHNFARNAFWFVEKEKAQDYMVIGKDMSAPARLVRRRVSPPEVIE